MQTMHGLRIFFLQRKGENIFLQSFQVSSFLVSTFVAYGYCSRMFSIENNVRIAFGFYEFLKEIMEHFSIAFSSMLFD